MNTNSIVGEHAEGLVHEQVAGGLRAVVPGAVDPRGRGDVLVDVVFGARGRQRALVLDEAGEQAAALAFDLRVDAPFRGGRADDGVGLEMAELMPRVDTFGPLGDRHAHRDARPLRPPALGARAAPLASGQVLPEIQDPLRLGVDLLVEALVAGPHARVVGESDREPSLDAFGRPALPQGVLDWRHAAVYGVLGHGRIDWQVHCAYPIFARKGGAGMANTPTTTMRLDPELKDQGMRVLEPLGLNMTGAVTIFLKAVVRENGMPFELKAQPRGED